MYRVINCVDRLASSVPIDGRLANDPRKEGYDRRSESCLSRRWEQHDQQLDRNGEPVGDRFTNWNVSRNVTRSSPNGAGATRRSGKLLRLPHNAIEAVDNVDVIYTDVWASMGAKDKADVNAERLRNFQVNMDLVKHANPNVIVMHCLPAERGREITHEVMESKYAVVFDEAENRPPCPKGRDVDVDGIIGSVASNSNEPGSFPK